MPPVHILIRWRQSLLSLLILILSVEELKGQEKDNGTYLLRNFGQIGKNASRLEIDIGAMLNDVSFMPYARQKRYIQAPVINLDLILPSPQKILKPIGSPRFYLGFFYAAIPNGINTLHGGLTWDLYFSKNFYALLALGGTVVGAHKLNAVHLYKDPKGYQAVGCRVLFNMGLGLGLDVMDRFTLQLYSNHSSNAGLCSPNGSVDATGIRLGFRF